MDLTRDAMLVTLRIHHWSGKRYDRKASDHVAYHHDADADAGRYTKRLLPKAAFAALTRAVSAARTAHYDHTLPWDDRGRRLLTVDNFDHYTATLDGCIEQMVRRPHPVRRRLRFPCGPGAREPGAAVRLRRLPSEGGAGAEVPHPLPGDAGGGRAPLPRPARGRRRRAGEARHRARRGGPHPRCPGRPLPAARACGRARGRAAARR